MVRKIIHIDDEKCNGCGACASACHEGAIGMVNGKARLLRDDYCDGLGDCLPVCPVGAITFVEREAAEYDSRAVAAHKQANNSPLPCGCPGSASRSIKAPDSASCECRPVNRLAQWPVQIKLAPVNAHFFNGADLLIAADCTAYAYAAFHEDFMRNHITLIGCPKLDDINYADKLARIFLENDVRSICVARMEVPCCGGLERAVKLALRASGKSLPLRIVTLTTDGRVLSDKRSSGQNDI